MTEDEKRLQKAMLLLEYQEAESHLASLCESARWIETGLRNAIAWLEAMNAGATQPFSVKTQVSTDSGKPIKLDDPTIFASMNFAAYVKLGGEIEQAQAKLRELASRKQSLGLK